MIDPYSWLVSELRSGYVVWRLRKVCPHPEHRVFPFEEIRHSGIFCDDCQAILAIGPNEEWTDILIDDDWRRDGHK